MKRTTKSFRTATMLLILLLSLIMISCSKEDIQPPKQEPTPTPTVVAKINNIVATPSTRPWWNGDLQIEVQASNANEIWVGEQKLVGGNTYTFQNVTSGSVHQVKAVCANGSTDTKTFMIPDPWSQKTTLLCNGYKVYMISGTQILRDTLSNATSPPVAVGLFTDTSYYKPDGTGYAMSRTGTKADITWVFLQNETWFGSNPTDPQPWKILNLDETEFRLWQSVPDGGIPNAVWETTFVYRKVRI